MKTGSILKFIDNKYNKEYIFIIEEKGRNNTNINDNINDKTAFSLAKINNPYHRLILNQKYDISYSSNDSNKGNTFKLVLSNNDIDVSMEDYDKDLIDNKINHNNSSLPLLSSYDNLCYKLQSCSCKNKDSINYCIGVSKTGKLIGGIPSTRDNNSNSDISFDFTVTCHLDQTDAVKDTSLLVSNRLLIDRNILQPWQIHRIILEGYLLIPNCIDLLQIRNCNYYLNNLLGLFIYNLYIYIINFLSI
jgi:hypothetical protein